MSAICQILIGDVRAKLRELPEASVQTVVTSPPYWGLRAYGTIPQVWGGVAECAHEWISGVPIHRGGATGNGVLREGGRSIVAAHDSMKDFQTGSTCRKCGAWIGELGHEPTPELWADHIVEVFAEVWRVLKDDGTCWANFGDCYSSGGRGSYDSDAANKGQTAANGLSRTTPPNLKPKDLVGQPWLAAFALRQPRYMGTIKNRVDRAWLAAMVDAEGCIFIHKRGAGLHAGDGYVRQSDTYSPGLEISNTHEAIVKRVHQIACVGSISSQLGKRRQRIFRWTVRAEECRKLIQEVYPDLIGKKHQARLAFSCPTSGESASNAHLSLMALHAGGAPCFDLAAPRLLFFPGWYLRQEIIWAKPNPMPESVTDRCTKAHEQIFLLTKQPRYFFDAEAISEPVTGNSHPRGDGVNAKIKTPEGWDTDPGSHGSFNKNGRGMGPKGEGRDDANLKPADRFGRGAGWRTKQNPSFSGAVNGLVDTRNKRSVWTIPTEPYSEAHFATFPSALVRPCIQAGSRIGDTVLDPFAGSGTVGMVAAEYGRSSILIDLNPANERLMRDRIAPHLGQGVLL